MHYQQVLLVLITYITLGASTELTFELPDNEKQCFYEDLDSGVKFDIDFQVSSWLLL